MKIEWDKPPTFGDVRSPDLEKTVAICRMILQVEVHGFDCLADLVIRVTNGHKTFLTTILGKWLCRTKPAPLFLQLDNTVLDIF